MTNLTAMQEMAAYDTLRDEFEEILWSYAQGVDTEQIEKAFKEALKDFRETKIKE